MERRENEAEVVVAIFELLVFTEAEEDNVTKFDKIGIDFLNVMVKTHEINSYPETFIF